MRIDASDKSISWPRRAFLIRCSLQLLCRKTWPPLYYYCSMFMRHKFEMFKDKTARMRRLILKD
jgi:hypothetical protein